MNRLLDLTDQRFGKLVALELQKLERDGGDWKPIKWLCVCDCGNTKVIASNKLMTGDTRSCGCLLDEIRKKGFNRKHGLGHTPEFRIWAGIKTRCTNEKEPGWPRYGGRGIKMCDRWMDSFENFYEDMGPRPSKHHSIERENNDGNYEPDNCFWATRTEQARNRRSNVYYDYEGEKLVLPEIAKRVGMNHTTLFMRINYQGLSLEEAIAKRVRPWNR